MKRTLLCVLIVLTLIASLGIYQYSKLNNVSKTDENDVTSSSALAMVLVDGYGDNSTETEIDSFPDPNTHYLDFAKSYCLNGAKIGWDKANNKVKITSNKADSCKLYFRAGTAVNMKADVLAKNTLVTTTPDFSQTATDTNTNIYQAEDDYGISYYFRGDVTNNYVEFGSYAAGSTVGDTTYNEETPMYWRIIRINGDGTIRLVYDGTTKAENGITHTSIIGYSAYNSEYDNKKYMGYTYDTSDEDKTQVNSTIKGVVDTWYDIHLESKYATYISDSIFCNDRTVSRVDEFGFIYYESYIRLDDNKSPSLKCTNKSDRYTVSDTANGNGYLSNPVGLITADEESFAGNIGYGTNKSYYLYSGGSYWIPTSYHWTVGGARIIGWGINNGTMETYYAGAELGVRPVINLDADLLFTGNGTIDSPYVVAGYEQ